MLCPEIWDFEAPQHYVDYDQGLYKTKDEPAVLKEHYFNHSVSVVIPNTSSIPESLDQGILEDTDYYKVNGLRPYHLLDGEFIEAFVKQGELNLVSVGKKIDLENAIAVLPTGQLILSLVTEDYQKLGLEGRQSYFDRTEDTRHVVTVDLKGKSIVPDKKIFQRIRECLLRRLEDTFDVIVYWEPSDEAVCPSSIAAWFHKRGYTVSLCHQKLHRRTENSTNLPIFQGNCDSSFLDRFFEWLGFFSIGGRIAKDEEGKYANAYECPSPSINVGQVQYLQYTGFLTRRLVGRIVESVREYASSAGAATTTWCCSVDVQGFADSPVSWGEKEHSFYIDGDNSYTFVFLPNDKYVLRKSLSSNNKPRITQ